MVIMYEAMSAELYIEKMLPSAAGLPMLRRAMKIGITREK
jgi:hypothetical protein